MADPWSALIVHHASCQVCQVAANSRRHFLGFVPTWSAVWTASLPDVGVEGQLVYHPTGVHLHPLDALIRRQSKPVILLERISTVHGLLAIAVVNQDTCQWRVTESLID